MMLFFRWIRAEMVRVGRSVFFSIIRGFACQLSSSSQLHCVIHALNLVPEVGIKETT